MKRVTRLGGDVKKKSTAKVLRVAAYCRVSTGSDAQLESLDAQKLTMKTTSMDVRIGSLPVCILTKASPAPRKKSDLRCFR